MQANQLQLPLAISLFQQEEGLNPDEAFEVGEFALTHPTYLG